MITPEWLTRTELAALGTLLAAAAAVSTWHLLRHRRPRRRDPAPPARPAAPGHHFRRPARPPQTPPDPRHGIRQAARDGTRRPPAGNRNPVK